MKSHSSPIKSPYFQMQNPSQFLVNRPGTSSDPLRHLPGRCTMVPPVINWLLYKAYYRYIYQCNDELYVSVMMSYIYL
jgi:hypothetical protein